jgi:hypothetical protein
MHATLSPDHVRLLALARRAISARDDKALWKRSLKEGVETHGTACDAVWDELERQVTLAAGEVPVLEHPSATQKRRAAQMRKDIIAAVQHALTDALDDLANGTFDWDDN